MKAKKAKIKKKQETRVKLKYREWERNRRDRLNVSILALYSTLPNYDPAVNRSKVDVITQATTYIKELHEKVYQLMEKNDCNNLFVNEISQLKKKITDLTMRCRQLSDLLKQYNVPLPSGVPEECIITAIKEQQQKWTDQIKPEMIKEFLKMIKKNKENKKNIDKEGENKNSKINNRNDAKNIRNVNIDAKKSKSLVKINNPNCISSAPLSHASNARSKTSKGNNSAVVNCATTDIQSTTVNTSVAMPLRELNCTVLNKAKTIKSVVTSTNATTTSLVTTTSKPVSIALSDQLPKTGLVTVTKSNLLSTPIMATGIQTLPSVINRNSSLLGPGTLILPDGRIVNVPPPPTPITTVIAAGTQFIVNRPVNPPPAVIVIPNSNVNTVINNQTITNNVTNISNKVVQKSYTSNTKMIVPKPLMRSEKETTKTTFANKVPIPALSTHQHNVITYFKLQKSIKQATVKSNLVGCGKNSKMIKNTSGSSTSKTLSKEMGNKKKSLDKQKSSPSVKIAETRPVDDKNIKSTSEFIENDPVLNSHSSENINTSTVSSGVIGQVETVSCLTTDMANEEVKNIALFTGSKILDENQIPDVDEETSLAKENQNNVKNSSNKRPLQSKVSEETDVPALKKSKPPLPIGEDKSKIVISDETDSKKNNIKSIDEQENQNKCDNFCESNLISKTPNNFEKYSIDALCFKNSSDHHNVKKDSIVVDTDKNRNAIQCGNLNNSNEIVTNLNLSFNTKNISHENKNCEFNGELNVNNGNLYKIQSSFISEEDKVTETSDRNPTKSVLNENEVTKITIDSDTKHDVNKDNIKCRTDNPGTINKNEMKDQELNINLEPNITQCINNFKNKQSEIFCHLSPIKDNFAYTSRNSDTNFTSLSSVTTAPSSVLSSMTCAMSHSNNYVDASAKSLLADVSNKTFLPSNLIESNCKQKKILTTAETTSVGNKNVAVDVNVNKLEQNNFLKKESREFIYNESHLSDITNNKRLVDNVNSILQTSDYSFGSSRTQHIHHNHQHIPTTENKCALPNSTLKSVQTSSDLHLFNQQNKDKNVFLPISNNHQNNSCIDDVRLSIPNSEFSNDLFTSLQVPSGSQHPESLSPTAAFLLAFPLVSTSKTSEMLVDNETSDSQHATPTTLLQIGNIEPPSNNLFHNDSPGSTSAMIVGNNIVPANNDSFSGIKVDRHVSNNSSITHQLSNETQTNSTSVALQSNNVPRANQSSNSAATHQSNDASVLHRSNHETLTVSSNNLSIAQQLSNDTTLLSNNASGGNQSNGQVTQLTSNSKISHQSNNTTVSHQSNNNSVAQHLVNAPTHQSNTTTAHQSVSASGVHKSRNAIITCQQSNTNQLSSSSVTHQSSNVVSTHQSTVGIAHPPNNVPTMQQTRSASKLHLSSSGAIENQTNNASVKHLLNDNNNRHTTHADNVGHCRKLSDVNRNKTVQTDKNSSNYLVPASFDHDHHFTVDGNYMPVTVSNICFNETSDLNRNSIATYNKVNPNGYSNITNVNKLHDKRQQHRSTDCVNSSAVNVNAHQDIYLPSCNEKKKTSGTSICNDSLVEHEHNTAYDSFTLPNMVASLENNYQDKLYEHRNVQFSSSNPTVNSRQKMNANRIPTSISDICSSSSFTSASNKKITMVSTERNDIIPACTYTQAISSSSASLATQSYSYNFFSNCNDFPLSTNSHHPYPASTNDLRQQSSVDIKCNSSNNLNIFPNWSSSNVSTGGFTCNATFSTSYPTMTTALQKSCSTQTTVAKSASHNHQNNLNAVENNSLKNEKNSLNPLPKFSANFNFTPNNHSFGHQDIFNSHSTPSSELFKNDKSIKKSSKVSSAAVQPRPPVNWMTTPDLRPSLHEVTPSLVPDMMFLTSQKEIDFVTPNMNMNNCSNLPPFSIANSTQPFYGLDIPLDIPAQFPEVSNTTNKSSHRTSSTTSSSMNQQVPSHHYSWSPSKSTLPLLSHLDSHSLMIPSTLPTLVGDLALGTNTGPSTPAIDTNIRSFNIPPPPPTMPLHSFDDSNKINKYNQSKCRLENAPSQLHLQTNQIKVVDNPHLNNKCSNHSNIINNQIKETKECPSNTNAKNTSLRNNNNSSNEFCNSTVTNKSSHQTHQSTNTAGSFLSVSQLVDQAKSEGRNVTTRRINKSQQSSGNNSNKQSTVNNNNNNNTSNVSLQKPSTNNLTSLLQQSDTKGHPQQNSKMSNHTQNNFGNCGSSRKLFTDNGDCHIYPSSSFSSVENQNVATDSLVHWHSNVGSSNNSNKILSSYKGGNYSAESLIGVNHGHHDTVSSFASSSAGHQLSHQQHHRMNHHSHHSYNQIQKPFSSVETPILPVSSISSAPVMNSSTCSTTNIVNPDLHSISNNMVQHHSGVGNIDFVSNTLTQNGPSQQPVSSYQNCFNFTPSTQNSTTTYPSTNHSIGVPFITDNDYQIGCLDTSYLFPHPTPGPATMSHSSTNVTTTFSTVTSVVSNTTSGVSVSVSVPSITAMSSASLATNRNCRTTLNQSTSTVNKITNSSTSMTSINSNNHKTNRKRKDVDNFTSVAPSSLSVSSSVPSTTSASIYTSSYFHPSHVSYGNSLSSNALPSMRGIHNYQPVLSSVAVTTSSSACSSFHNNVNHSTSTLTNFNLSAIFPEINDKQRNGQGHSSNFLAARDVSKQLDIGSANPSIRNHSDYLPPLSADFNNVMPPQIGAAVNPPLPPHFPSDSFITPPSFSTSQHNQ